MKIAAAVMAGLALLIVLPGLSAAFGAFAGWTVGLVFGDTMRAGQIALGIKPPLEPWQIGALLGFVGGFFNGGGRAAEARRS
jgi:hypothetical protein